MPVQQRARGAADDHKLDTVTKENPIFPLNTSVIAKARRGGNHNHVKDIVVVPSEADLSCQPHDGHNGVMTCGTYIPMSASANKCWHVAVRSTGLTWTRRSSMLIGSYTAFNSRQHSDPVSTNVYSAALVFVDDPLQ